MAGVSAGRATLEAWRFVGPHATRVRLAIGDTVFSVGDAFGVGQS